MCALEPAKLLCIPGCRCLGGQDACSVHGAHKLLSLGLQLHEDFQLALEDSKILLHLLEQRLAQLSVRPHASIPQLHGNTKLSAWLHTIS